MMSRINFARAFLLFVIVVMPGCQQADFDDTSLHNWRADYELPLHKRSRAKANRLDKLGRFLSKKDRDFALTNLGMPDEENQGVFRYELGYDLIDAYRVEIHFDDANLVSEVVVTHN